MTPVTLSRTTRARLWARSQLVLHVHREELRLPATEDVSYTLLVAECAEARGGGAHLPGAAALTRLSTLTEGVRRGSGGGQEGVLTYQVRLHSLD
eukprot:1188223-Prorocentrum_minimum.AAC.3